MSLIKLIILVLLTYLTTSVLSGPSDKERQSSRLTAGERGERDDKVPEFRGRKQDRRRCNRLEKSELISKLINLYSEEYERQLDVKQSDVHTLLKHKFSTLDVDRDQYLNRNEFKEFRNTIKSRTRYNNCATSLFRVIDLNSDKRISLSEWISFYTHRRAKSRRAKPSPSDWPSSIAAVHGLSLLNQKSDKDHKSDKEKEMNEDELDQVDFTGFNVESIAFKPNSSESRQMMISRLKKILVEGKVIPTN